MVSSVVEPEWDEEQLNLVLAEQFVRNMTGPNGEWMPEATSPDADPNAYSGYRYAPEGPFINQAEKVRLDAEEALRKSLGKDANMNGIYFTVKKVEY
jgi:hypothetical protein